MATERSLSVAKPQTGKGSGRGGARKGSGRKPLGRKSIKIRLTPEERAMLDKKRGPMRLSVYVRTKLGLSPSTPAKFMAKS